MNGDRLTPLIQQKEKNGLRKSVRKPDVNEEPDAGDEDKASHSPINLLSTNFSMVLSRSSVSLTKKTVHAIAV